MKAKILASIDQLIADLLVSDLDVELINGTVTVLHYLYRNIEYSELFWVNPGSKRGTP